MACFSFVGFQFARSLEGVLSQLRIFQMAVSKLASHMGFGIMPLREIFALLQKEEGETGAFFAYTGRQMDSKEPLGQIWKNYMKERENTQLPPRALEQLAACGELLEGSDMAASLQALKAAQNAMETCYEELYSEYRNKIKTYPAVGLLAGLFVSVIFL